MAHLECFHMLTTLKFYTTINTIKQLVLVSKKYRQIFEMLHFNPVPINNKTIAYFPHLETLHLYNPTDETFGNKVVSSTQIENTNRVAFYKVVVWFEVDYETTITHQTIEYKNICYSKSDRVKYGDKIPPVVHSLGYKCFEKCTFKSFVVPTQITSLGERCFSDCCNLQSITIPDTVLSLGKSCFYYCSDLEDVSIGSNVRSIGSYCFEGCYMNLCTIEIPEGLTSLGDDCFCGCGNLSKVKLPSTLKVFDIEWFTQCYALRQIELPRTAQIDTFYFHIFDTNREVNPLCKLKVK
ncbi:hypothetical protein EIN_319420 [Entamoeba invadens IP1]|uniref:Leucine rich repeat containing protein BspA family protein n=1 Tax=Entamoeba invadens IP1 TaxID=370355 RepID=A0A0A1U2X8_ENTIV|nr:hypothetical protein EIN_319420 [Entamoeba invadens IP1]ELP87023.1 hypothetical protein EIN_319420 [Entamoeba invadens IP1]|eukprot:XP_004253794.1 hypothetical protein EIN_319420 [Entamoeba invadens IP1]